MERKERPVNWENAIPNVLPSEAAGLDAARPSTSMDSDRFAEFYERSARPLWAYLARVSGNAALADDLLQESFLRFLCADHPTDGEVSARRYLFRIATNLLRDHWRRPRAASLEDIPEELFRTRDHSSECDSKATLGPALKAMRPRERQLLWLAYAEGYSHREIAEITGLATASIKLLLFRARRKVARLLVTPDLSPDRRAQ
ncbi:MAG TPA: sigma-70 family RNA polymerase sigma factor [Bryobacteraceae bacterium]|nr:sigma-70 family RNA polymerase sigma factor [Bryobacteraceae bacterium]